MQNKIMKNKIIFSPETEAVMVNLAQSKNKSAKKIAEMFNFEVDDVIKTLNRHLMTDSMNWGKTYEPLISRKIFRFFGFTFKKYSYWCGCCGEIYKHYSFEKIFKTRKFVICNKCSARGEVF